MLSVCVRCVSISLSLPSLIDKRGLKCHCASFYVGGGCAFYRSLNAAGFNGLEETSPSPREKKEPFFFPFFLTLELHSDSSISLNVY